MSGPQLGAISLCKSDPWRARRPELTGILPHFRAKIIAQIRLPSFSFRGKVVRKIRSRPKANGERDYGRFKIVLT